MPDRKAYQEAVQCLMRSPSRYKDVEGARTAWDDYGVLHYYQTPYVHNSATFLLWHRHYNWVLEQDLQGLCGYKGTYSLLPPLPPHYLSSISLTWLLPLTRGLPVLGMGARLWQHGQVTRV